MKETEGMAEAIRDLSASIKESFFQLAGSVESLSQSFQLMVTKMTVDSQIVQNKKVQELPAIVSDAKEIRKLLCDCQLKFGTDEVKKVLKESTGFDRLTDIDASQYVVLKQAILNKLKEI